MPNSLDDLAGKTVARVTRTRNKVTILFTDGSHLSAASERYETECGGQTHALDINVMIPAYQCSFKREVAESYTLTITSL